MTRRTPKDVIEDDDIGQHAGRQDAPVVDAQQLQGIAAGSRRSRGQVEALP